MFSCWMQFTRARKYRWHWPTGRLVLAGVLAGVVVAAAQPAAGLAIGWSVVPSPNRGTQSNTLFGVSCVSGSFCAAVGTVGNVTDKTLAESWNGTKWSVVPSPNPVNSATFNKLFGVSCVSASFCIAVGTYTKRALPLIESWNGTKWSVVSGPSPVSPGNILDAVSCVSASFCTAVGRSATGTLVESWNGTTWSVVPSPSPGSVSNDLAAVSCLSATACTAVGTQADQGAPDRILVESWNGTTWSVLPSPNKGNDGDALVGVSCVSATDCTAAGDYTNKVAPKKLITKTLVESWNGTTWSVVPSPNTASTNNHLTAISCISTSACTAAGFRNTTGTKTLIESWNGTTWSVAPSPNKGNGHPPTNQLFSLSCVATACTAAGFYATGHGPVKTLIEASNGTAGR